MQRHLAAARLSYSGAFQGVLTPVEFGVPPAILGIAAADEKALAA